MCFNEDIVQPFEVWEHFPLTVISEAFPSRSTASSVGTLFTEPQVRVNLRLSTGKSQSLLTFHQISQVQMLAEALCETVDIIKDALDHGKPGLPILVTKVMAGIPAHF